MSAHLCKQIAASWKEIRHPFEAGQTSPTGNSHFGNGSYFPRAGSPTNSDHGKSSMDCDCDHAAPSMRRTTSNSSWGWASR
ncbi:hypothetical protein VPNG_06780 [Cytospora leucostoma]|uniref:Uncharacterized protein n=1 Tax=Cytospora leucostoma TaxID=1230097 RepID=A0A423WVT3_9PEZI|nr:hypothetical protein VPNG_06780 [Cytospora leucostoma]